VDTRLLGHYDTELRFLREMGTEFAKAYPKVAARLGIGELEVVDPYVERLLEGTAFLAARVQLELELQYPNFASHLFEIVYPEVLAPTPSMMVAQLVPDVGNAALDDGHKIKRGTVLRSKPAHGTSTACQFTTAHDVTLWPIEVAEAEYIDGRGAVVAAGLGDYPDAVAAIRLRLRRHGSAPISELGLDTLQLYLSGDELSAWLVHELLANDAIGVMARSTDRRADWSERLPTEIVARGFEREEALLPTPRQSFDGYRLLREYFAMPQRFRFVDISGLSHGLARADGSDLDLFIALKGGHSGAQAAVVPGVFALHCVPAINLFERRCDRVQIRHAQAEHHVVPDRTAPLDFEIYAIRDVVGISASGEDDIPFAPFYSVDGFTPLGNDAPAYYTQIRRMRQRTQKEKLRGPRTTYLGADTFLDLVDPGHAPYRSDLAQLSVRALVTNRDLPLLLSSGDPDQFHLPTGGPVAKILTPIPPTRPRPTIAQGEVAWRLISHLSLNYLSICDTEGGSGASALRELLGIYAPVGDRIIKGQIEGITAIRSRPKVRRVRDEVLSTAVRGLEVTIECDETAFEGASVYVLGQMLDRFLQKYVAINSFVECALVTQQRGEVARWAPRVGKRQIL
jgi:type VI secretion system protein ImpG